MQCIHAAEPMFMPQLLAVQEDVYEHLTRIPVCQSWIKNLITMCWDIYDIFFAETDY